MEPNLRINAGEKQVEPGSICFILSIAAMLLSMALIKGGKNAYNNNANPKQTIRKKNGYYNCNIRC